MQGLVQVIDHDLQRPLPAPPRRRAVAAEAPTDISPRLAVAAHPHEVPLLDVQPLHPTHRLQHPVNRFRTGREVVARLLVRRQAFPLLAHDGGPDVEVALYPNGWQASSSTGGFFVACGHLVNRPVFAGHLTPPVPRRGAGWPSAAGPVRRPRCRRRGCSHAPEWQRSRSPCPRCLCRWRAS